MKEEFEDLKSFHGATFRGRIEGVALEGKISVSNNEDREVFLCQDIKNGRDADNKLGYKFSWTVVDGSPLKLRNNHVVLYTINDRTVKLEGDKIIIESKLGFLANAKLIKLKHLL